MASAFLQIPINAELITRQKQLKRCSLNESVSGLMHLIIITHFGENKQDASFGNELWERDFETVENIQAFREKLSGSLHKAIIQYEKRLADVKVGIDFDQVLTTVYNRRVRQRIHIVIEGTLRKTNESFVHREVFFMGPLSYY
ncbi:MAG: GPW/gp25 family protein [Bacteroidales bacterium]